MSRDRRARVTGRRLLAPFLALPIHMLNSLQFAQLSAPANKLVLDIGGLFNGKNNGEIEMPYGTLMRERHWRSRTSIVRALGELIQSGFVLRTRKGRCDGGAPEASLYAISWQPIHESEMHTMVSRVAPNTWKVQNASPYNGPGKVKPVHAVDRARQKDGLFCSKNSQFPSPQTQSSSPRSGLSLKNLSRGCRLTAQARPAKTWPASSTPEYDTLVQRFCFFKVKLQERVAA